MIKFTIPIESATKKNHGFIIHTGNPCPVCKRGMGNTVMLPSAPYQKYEKACKKHMPKIDTINFPVNIKYIFYKGTHRKCDLTGLIQAIDDIMVKYGIIADDNFSIVVGHDGSRVMYDKAFPRTEVVIEEIKDD